MAYPYTAAFVAYCGGTPVEEIAAEFNIPIKSLKAKIRQEGWRNLANRAPLVIDVSRTPSDGALSKCEANRARNYDVAAALRDDVVNTVANLRAGTLKIKKQFHNKGEVVEYEAEPNIVDRINLATYATTVANMTYRALGDHVANGGYRQTQAQKHLPPPRISLSSYLALSLCPGVNAPK